jgi:predicted DNA-binding protein (MmcQ/YjbR family)
MTKRELIDYCLTLPAVYEDYPFGDDVTVVKIKSPSQDKGRIFAQIFMLKGEPKATFNCSADTGEFYRSIYPESVTRGYHCPSVQQLYFNTVNI